MATRGLNSGWNRDWSKQSEADQRATDRAFSSWTGTSFEDASNDMMETGYNDPEFETASFSMSPTPSTNPKRPRTTSAGYDYSTETMTVVFRDGTWWEYRGISKDMWEEFKMSPSPGKFLRESGLDSWDDMGPANVGAMPAHRRVKINENAAQASRLYGD
jgi:KTSC domain